MTTVFPRIRRVVPGIGLVQIPTDCTTRREHDRRVTLFHELVEDGQLGLIRALVNEMRPASKQDQAKPRVTWAELIDQRRARGGGFGNTALADISLKRDLAAAITDTLPKMGKAKATRVRYKQSLDAFLALGVATTVQTLESVDWLAVSEAWPNGAADWNHVRRALSAFLTKYLGNKHHPFRTTLLPKIPGKTETPREPDLTPDIFRAILSHVREDIRPAYWTLLLTGMRRAEYLRAGREHLRPATCRVLVPGSKTERATASVAVEAEFWPWIEQGIPSPLRYKALRGHWNAACLAAGVAVKAPRYQGPTLHSLRHTMAQWAEEGGAPLTEIMRTLRHANITTTSKYAQRSATTHVARAVGDRLRALR